MPKRHDFTHIQPRSSAGSPRCASSQSRTARTPSGPTTRVPFREAAWTSTADGGAARGGGGGVVGEPPEPELERRMRLTEAVEVLAVLVDLLAGTLQGKWGQPRR